LSLECYVTALREINTLLHYRGIDMLNQEHEDLTLLESIDGALESDEARALAMDDEADRKEMRGLVWNAVAKWAESKLAMIDKDVVVAEPVDSYAYEMDGAGT